MFLLEDLWTILPMVIETWSAPVGTDCSPTPSEAKRGLAACMTELWQKMRYGVGSENVGSFLVLT
jgi:hypothetical protein